MDRDRLVRLGKQGRTWIKQHHGCNQTMYTQLEAYLAAAHNRRR
jgi:hypothetical protein